MKKHISFYMIIVILLITILSLLFISCKQNPSSLYTYQPPENTGDGLDVGSLDEVNIDQALIERAACDISRGIYGEVHSILIFKDDMLVFEEYFEGHIFCLLLNNF